MFQTFSLGLVAYEEQAPVVIHVQLQCDVTMGPDDLWWALVRLGSEVELGGELDLVFDEGHRPYVKCLQSGGKLKPVWFGLKSFYNLS